MSTSPGTRSGWATPFAMPKRQLYSAIKARKCQRVFLNTIDKQNLQSPSSLTSSGWLDWAKSQILLRVLLKTPSVPITRSPRNEEPSSQTTVTPSVSCLMSRTPLLVRIFEGSLRFWYSIRKRCCRSPQDMR